MMARVISPRRLAQSPEPVYLLQMFRDGDSPETIAAKRGLAVSTIEGHLSRFIPTGEVSLNEVVPAVKIPVIRKALVDMKVENVIGPVKEYLGDDYSYGEIKAVMADLEREL